MASYQTTQTRSKVMLEEVWEANEVIKISRREWDEALVREACQANSQFTQQISLYYRCSRRVHEVEAIKEASHLIIKTHMVKPQVEVGLVVIQQQSQITVLCNIRIRWHLMDPNRTRTQQQASHINNIQTLNSHGSIRKLWKTMQTPCTRWQVHS